MAGGLPGDGIQERQAEDRIIPTLIQIQAYCPICEREQVISARSDEDIPEAERRVWFRSSLRCEGCKAPPRERALALVLNRVLPDWRSRTIHESSPSQRGLSLKLRRDCAAYVPTQFDLTFPFGQMDPTGAWRNENLEAQTFADGTFDVVVTQDVFEHLFNPGRAAREIARTLRPGGLCIMTVPVVRPWSTTSRRAALIDGEIVHLQEERYHGNPVGDGRSLVTVDWSYQIGAYLSAQSGLPFTVHVIDDMELAIRDPFNVVLAAVKASLPELDEYP